MTICNKIQTLGETMETNLNARGVSCAFGTGTGESTVLDMVEMVNGMNFKGSSDVNLKIGVNRPYLLTGETTDVVVKLENGLCEPLKNKSVTVSDGTNTVNGVTDEKGEFALYDVSVTDDTTFTATYGTETATCLVEYCDFVDYAVTNNKNNTWFNNTGGIITVDDSGTTFTSVPHPNGTHWTCGYCPSSTTSRNPFSYPIVVEFDILHWTDSGSIWIKSDLGNRTSFNRELNHIGSRARIEIGTTSTKIYIDGTLVSTKTYTQPSTYGIELGYYAPKSSFPTAPSLKFANLSIRPL